MEQGSGPPAGGSGTAGGGETPPRLERDAARQEGTAPDGPPPRTSGLARGFQRLLSLPERPVPRFIDWFAGVLGLVALLVTTIVSLQGNTSSKTADPSDSTNSVPAPEAGFDTYSAEQYLHEGGGTPARSPSPEGLFDLTLGAPVERALQHLGPEDSRFAVAAV